MMVIREMMILVLKADSVTSGPDNAPPGRAWPVLESLSAPSSAPTAKEPAHFAAWHTSAKPKENNV